MGGQFNNKNTGKRGISLNIRHPKGLQIAKDLVRICDIVAEGFSPGVLERLGLGYDVMRKIRPDIIYIQQAGMGAHGTYGRMRTVGPVAAAFAGQGEMSGLPDPAMPVGWGYSYLDWMGAYGYALALLIGITVGALVARIPVLRAAIGSMITGLQTMPSIAWLPFAIILFGLNNSAIIFVIVMVAAPSIANGVIAGVDYTPPLLLKAGRLMGLRGAGLTRHLIVPAALPTFVGGMKQAWAFTWHGLLTAELLVLVAGEPSIGVLFQSDQEQTDMPSTIAIMIVILVLGIAVDGLFGLANRAIRKRWGLT